METKALPVLTQREASRFYNFVSPEPMSGCYLWTGECNRRGYGKIRVRNEKFLAHRLSFSIAVKDPQSLLVLHKCDNPCCVNPAHLFLGSQSDNLYDMHRKGRNWTPKGESHGASKLRLHQVLSIRADTRKNSIIARDFCIDRTTVRDIKSGKRWRIDHA
jgi:hypothetical protein